MRPLTSLSQSAAEELTIRTNKMKGSVAWVALAALGSLVAVAPASAQLANASTSTLGLSGNNTATVRGFGTISVNPAGLAMPGSGFSLALIPIQIRSGINPIGLKDLKDVEGSLVPTAVKQDWLDRVTADGGQSGTFGVDISEIAFTSGNIGFQISTVVAGAVDLSPGIVEAVLFGNAGRTGSPANLALSPASVEGFGITTAGLSIGIPISSPASDIAIGATLKYSVGHGLAVGRSSSGSVSADPVAVDLNFPVVHSTAFSFDNFGVGDILDGGTGIGVDVGFMVKKDNLSFGASVQNVVNTFEWDESKLSYRAGTASFETGSSDSDFDERAYASAPADLRQAVTDMQFKPAIRAGIGLDVSGDFTVTGDLHARFSDDGIALGPKFHLGGGAEFRGLKVIHLRGGAAVITDGIQYGGGASLVLGPLNFSAAAAVQSGDIGDNVLAQFALSFGNR